VFQEGFSLAILGGGPISIVASLLTKLYGEVFELVSDPVAVSENFVFVDALERKSGQVRRVRIPLTIVQKARIERRAA
jgi:hypothetical protein